MILKRVSLGISIAGLFMAAVTVGQTAPLTAGLPPAVETGDGKDAADFRKILRVRLVESRETGGGKAREGKAPGEEPAEGEPGEDEPGEEGQGAVVVIDTRKLARDIEKAADEAVSAAINTLEDIEADLRIELNGERLKVKTEKYRETLDEARERLQGIGERIAEHAAEVEVRVTRAGEKAAEAAREAVRPQREKRVIVIRDGNESQIRVEKDKEGRTVVIIEGEDVKIITREKPDQEEN